MTVKEKKKAQELANFILNNITLAEIMSILARRSTEIANQIVREKLPAEKYRAIIVSEDSSFGKKVKMDTKSKDGWLTRLFKKIGLMKDPPPAPKQKKPVNRKGFTGKKRKGIVGGKK